KKRRKKGSLSNGDWARTWVKVAMLTTAGDTLATMGARDGMVAPPAGLPAGGASAKAGVNESKSASESARKKNVTKNLLFPEKACNVSVVFCRSLPRKRLPFHSPARLAPTTAGGPSDDPLALTG